MSVFSDFYRTTHSIYNIAGRREKLATLHLSLFFSDWLCLRPNINEHNRQTFSARKAYFWERNANVRQINNIGKTLDFDHWLIIFTDKYLDILILTSQLKMKKFTDNFNESFRKISLLLNTTSQTWVFREMFQPMLIRTTLCLRKRSLSE